MNQMVSLWSCCRCRSMTWLAPSGGYCRRGFFDHRPGYPPTTSSVRTSLVGRDIWRRVFLPQQRCATPSSSVYYLSGAACADRRGTRGPLRTGGVAGGFPPKVSWYWRASRGWWWRRPVGDHVHADGGLPACFVAYHAAGRDIRASPPQVPPATSAWWLHHFPADGRGAVLVWCPGQCHRGLNFSPT